MRRRAQASALRPSKNIKILKYSHTNSHPTLRSTNPSALQPGCSLSFVLSFSSTSDALFPIRASAPSPIPYPTPSHPDVPRLSTARSLFLVNVPRSLYFPAHATLPHQSYPPNT
ncbi:hypothetical protein PTI98_001618 [Pleurotus ostreatus]|nr:hypothetical protein PTI98_001618 [Pleurotus ostreatus]